MLRSFGDFWLMEVESVLETALESAHIGTEKEIKK